MCIGTIEAVKAGVISGLVMSIVPDVSVLDQKLDVIVRPLKPAVPCTLAP
jgi:hypothetical protein